MFVTQLCNKRRQKRQSQNSPKFLNYIMQSAVKHKWYDVNRLTKRLQLNGHTKNYRILFTNSKVRAKLHFSLGVKKRLKKATKIQFLKLKSSHYTGQYMYLVPQYNQTCTNDYPGIQQQIIFYSLIGMNQKVRGHNSLQQCWWNIYTTLKGWSSIPVRWYKGISTPIAMILCLSHSNMLKYTVLRTYCCYNKHIF